MVLVTHGLLQVGQNSSRRSILWRDGDFYFQIVVLMSPRHVLEGEFDTTARLIGVTVG